MTVEEALHVLNIAAEGEYFADVLKGYNPVNARRAGLPHLIHWRVMQLVRALVGNEAAARVTYNLSRTRNIFTKTDYWELDFVANRHA